MSAILPPRKESKTMLAYREKAEEVASNVTGTWVEEGDAADLRALTEAVRHALVEEANLELRQIFAQMGGQLELALARTKRGQPAMSEEKLRSLIEGVHRASAILELFLDSASAAKLTIRLSPESFDLGEALREFLRLHALDGKIEHSLPAARVVADRTKLVDALGHLVTRFYFAARRHEKVLLTVHERDGSIEGFVGLTPSHLGLEELLQEIRVPMNVEDVGIEVAYIRAIVERHGGTLFVATAGEASTGFGFTMPVDPEAPR